MEFQLHCLRGIFLGGGEVSSIDLMPAKSVALGVHTNNCIGLNFVFINGFGKQ